MILLKCCTQNVSKFGKLSTGHRTGKVSFHFNATECSNYHIIALISHANKIMLKILQARLQQYVNWELPSVQPGFRKGRGTGDQIANIHWIKTSTFASLTMLKPLPVWITKLENSSRDGNTRPSHLPSEKLVCRTRSNSLNWTWNNGLVQNWERSMSKLYILTLFI